MKTSASVTALRASKPLAPLQLSDVDDMIGILPSPADTPTSNSPAPEAKTGRARGIPANLFDWSFDVRIEDETQITTYDYLLLLLYFYSHLFPTLLNTPLPLFPSSIHRYIMELFDNMFNWTDLCIEREIFDAYM